MEKTTKKNPKKLNADALKILKDKQLETVNGGIFSPGGICRTCGLLGSGSL